MTAVEFLEEKLKDFTITKQGLWDSLAQEWLNHYIEQAKQMEQQQMSSKEI